jgi:hypothetical protein
MTTVTDPPDQRTRLAWGTSMRWSTVAQFALPMAYGCGFWIISLRGAAGAIERTDAPFATWLRESTLMLPVFVLAVLGALMVAVRSLGPVLRSRKATAATALLVVAAGTLVGVVALVASSAYDYHLQSTQLGMMQSMRDTPCVGECAQGVQRATLALQLKVVGFGSLILASNLVVVSWVLALRGGQLKLTGARRMLRRGELDG